MSQPCQMTFFLYLSKMKPCAKDKLNVTRTVEFLFSRVEKFVKKREIAGCLLFCQAYLR